MFGFDKLKAITTNIPLNGFAGSCEGDLKRLPCLILGGKQLIDVPVAIPYLDTRMDILGLNVLEHFNYLIDGTNSKIYFSQNVNYKAPASLKCGGINAITAPRDDG